MPHPTSTPTAPAPLVCPAVKYQNGQVEHLAFAELDIFEKYQFVDLLVAGRSPEIVQLCARRNADWVKSLTFSSYRELINYFIKRNFSAAMEIATDDPIAGLKVGPLLMQMAELLRFAPGASSSPMPNLDVPSGNSLPSAPAPAASVPAISAPPSATPPAASDAGLPSGSAPAPSGSST